MKNNTKQNRKSLLLRSLCLGRQISRKPLVRASPPECHDSLGNRNSCGQETCGEEARKQFVKENCIQNVETNWTDTGVQLSNPEEDRIDSAGGQEVSRLGTWDPPPSEPGYTTGHSFLGSCFLRAL